MEGEREGEEGREGGKEHTHTHTMMDTGQHVVCKWRQILDGVNHRNDEVVKPLYL